jgi:hypothetical protein
MKAPPTAVADVAIIVGIGILITAGRRRSDAPEIICGVVG